MTTPLDPDQRVVIDTVEPGSLTARVLPLLSGRGAEAVDAHSTRG